MDFRLGYEQESIQKAAAEFAAGEFKKEIATEHERNHTFPYDILKKACELGFTGIQYPEECGGQEYGVLGFHQAMDLFNEIRIEVAAQALGIAQGAFDRALDRV